jgi:hypothetical protein
MTWLLLRSNSCSNSRFSKLTRSSKLKNKIIYRWNNKWERLSMDSIPASSHNRNTSNFKLVLDWMLLLRFFRKFRWKSCSWLTWSCWKHHFFITRFRIFCSINVHFKSTIYFSYILFKIPHNFFLCIIIRNTFFFKRKCFST